MRFADSGVAISKTGPTRPRQNAAIDPIAAWAARLRGSLSATSKPPSARFLAPTDPLCSSMTRAVIASPIPWPPCA